MENDNFMRNIFVIMELKMNYLELNVGLVMIVLLTIQTLRAL